ncbi:MAG: M23 family metallopeptidase [Wolbachia sp.]
MYAATEGVIEYIGNNRGYGKYIKIKYKNDYSTYYTHMSKFRSDAKLGSKVMYGKVLSLMLVALVFHMTSFTLRGNI